MNRALKAAEQYFKKLDKALSTSLELLPSSKAIVAELQALKGPPIQSIIRKDIESARSVIKGAEELNQYIEKYMPKMLGILDSWFHNPSDVGISETEAHHLVEVMSGLISVPCIAVGDYIDLDIVTHGPSVNREMYSDKALKQILVFKHIIIRFNSVAAKVLVGAEYDGDLSVLAEKMATSSEAKARAKSIVNGSSATMYMNSLLGQGIFLHSSTRTSRWENISEWVASLSSSVADMTRFMIEESRENNGVLLKDAVNQLAAIFISAMMVACYRGVCFQCDGNPESPHQIIRIKDIKLYLELQITAMEDYIELKDPSWKLHPVFKFSTGSRFVEMLKAVEVEYLHEIVVLQPLLERMIEIWIEALKMDGRSVKGVMKYATAAYTSRGYGGTQQDAQVVGTLGMYSAICESTKMTQLPSLDYMDLFCLVVEDLMARINCLAVAEEPLQDFIRCLNYLIFVDQQLSIERKFGTEITSSILRLYQATWRILIKLIKAYPQVDQSEGSKLKPEVDLAIGLLFEFQGGILFQEYMESGLPEWEKEHFDLVIDCSITAQKVTKVLAEPATRLVIAGLNKALQDDDIQGIIQEILSKLILPLSFLTDLCSEEDAGTTKYAALALHLSGLGELIWSLRGEIMINGSSSLPETLFLLFQAVVGMFPSKTGHAAINYRPYYEAAEVLLERSDKETEELKMPLNEKIKDFYQSWDSRSEDDIRTGALLKAAILARHSRCANPACINVDGFAEYRLKHSKCAACNVAFYCSKACQKAHWKSGHKQECSSLKEYLPDE